ncbi:hypothetical protein LNV09_03670 [Paucibacter sp. B2R-40]|uniref:hypothetical protein n=1 Tax=Paucibacter sp. B2R-40 TaxID=2893554 RepID=UPI0021E4E6AF|nr:hypothetical protein [Paucibacter sp. B2R-40]MCV2353255.1 hypothetical protein [Paucibacter sp. B2R-40]
MNTRFLLGLVLHTACLLPLGVQAANPLSDEELGGVSGRGGIVLNAHLELNTGATSENRVSLGFQVGGNTSYLLLHKLSGTLDLLGLTLQAVAGPAEIGDVIQLTLPTFVGFKDFGVKAIAVQSDPLAPIAASLGQIQLNGTVQMQGQVLLWAK